MLMHGADRRSHAWFGQSACRCMGCRRSDMGCGMSITRFMVIRFTMIALLAGLFHGRSFGEELLGGACVQIDPGGNERGRCERLLLHSGRQDALDASVASIAKVQRTRTSRFQALGSHTLQQTHQALDSTQVVQRTRLQQRAGDLLTRRTDLLGLLSTPLGGSLEVDRLLLGVVLQAGEALTALFGAGMGDEQVEAVEELDGLFVDMRLQHTTDVGCGSRVVAAFDDNMAIRMQLDLPYLQQRE